MSVIHALEVRFKTSPINGHIELIHVIIKNECKNIQKYNIEYHL